MQNKKTFGIFISLIIFSLIFTSLASSQNQYTCSSSKGQCSGTDSCLVNVEGTAGEKIQWTSSCGGNKETTINGQNKNVEFNCIHAGLTTGDNTLPNNPPIGWLDIANCEFIRGWALDEDAKDVSINVHLYKDGGAGTGGTALQAIETSQMRPDVHAIYHSDKPHGFMIQTPSSLKDGETHLIYVHGIDSTQDPAKSSLLSGVPKSIKCTSDATLIGRTLFSASPSTTINSGDEVTLNWVTASATSVKITDHNLNQLPNVQGATGSVKVNPAVSTTYILTASYPSGDVTKSVTVSVQGVTRLPGNNFAAHGGLNANNFAAASSNENLWEQKTLVIIAAIGSRKPPISADDAYTFIFGNEYGSLNDYYIKNSYGLTFLTGKVVGPYQLSNDVCDVEDIFDVIAQTPTTEFNFKDYSRIIIFSPKPKCEGLDFILGRSTVGKEKRDTKDGKAEVSISWVFNDKLQTVGHELGHGFGILGHAGSQNYEWGDPFSIMGLFNPGHHSGIDKKSLGWLDNTNFIVTNSPGEYLLTPLETSPLQGIKQIALIRPTIHHPQETYYMEFRQPIDYDAGFQDYNLYTGVLIRTRSNTGTSLINYASGSKSPLLQVGKTFQDPYKMWDITLKKIDSSGAHLLIYQYGATPELKIVSQKGDEVWEQGSRHTIKWSSSNLLRSQPIDISLDDYLLAKGTPNDGSEEIIVPQIPRSTFTNGVRLETNINGQEFYSQSNGTIFVGPCTDSDNGKEYYIKGVSQSHGPPPGFSPTLEDCCTSGAGANSNGNIGKGNVVDCFPNADYLYEYFCNPEGFLKSELYKCPNGCEDGVCLR